jgi:hypothetical protein
LLTAAAGGVRIEPCPVFSFPLRYERRSFFGNPGFALKFQRFGGFFFFGGVTGDT